MKYVGFEVLTAVVIYLLGYNAMQSIECQPTFQRNTSQSSAFTLVSCSAYFFDPEDGDNMFL
jgi:hypothetical protein